MSSEVMVWYFETFKHDEENHWSYGVEYCDWTFWNIK